MARLDDVLRSLEKRGARLDARAIKLVRGHYRQLRLDDLLALLAIAADLDSPAARMSYLDALLANFDRLAAVLGPAPPGLRELLESGVRLGTAATSEIIDATTERAYDLPATRELEYLRHAEKRFQGYWEAEGQRFRADVRRTLVEGLDRGMAPAQIAATLTERTGVSRSRATLIVRNEVGNCQAYAMEQDQSAMGHSRYKWSTARDSRVRPVHQEREGIVFRWDNPPRDGHPGQPILCRCVAIPVPDEEET